MTQDWIEQANCNGMDTKYFTLGKSDGVSIDRLKRTAKQVCTSCPVKLQCLKHASADDIAWTIRGGFTPKAKKKPRVKASEADIIKFIGDGWCRRKQDPHPLKGVDDLLVDSDSNRSRGYRLRCKGCADDYAKSRYTATLDA